MVDRFSHPRAGGDQRRGVPADLVPQRPQGRARRAGAAQADRAGDGGAGRAAAEARLAADAVPRAGQGGGGRRGDPPRRRGRGLDRRSTIEERTTETYRQERRGRPGPETRYVRQRGHAVRPDLAARPRPPGRGGAVRRDLPADHQRDGRCRRWSCCWPTSSSR